MAIRKISAAQADIGPSGEALLASGKVMAMRLWQDEAPQDKTAHRSPYETVGYVIKGRVELVLEGQTLELAAGDSWLVPAHADHTYRILEPLTALEVTSPPATGV